MGTWTNDELNKLGSAEELDLASFRPDGTMRKAVTMWVVRVADDVYVRSVNGRGSSWFRGVGDQHQARIRAGGIEKGVDLVETNDAGDEIDAAYDAKYGGRYPSIVPSIVSQEARAATLKLVPR